MVPVNKLNLGPVRSIWLKMAIHELGHGEIYALNGLVLQDFLITVKLKHTLTELTNFELIQVTK